jgi:hypothetical protein
MLPAVGSGVAVVVVAVGMAVARGRAGTKTRARSTVGSGRIGIAVEGGTGIILRLRLGGIVISGDFLLFIRFAVYRYDGALGMIHYTLLFRYRMGYPVWMGWVGRSGGGVWRSCFPAPGLGAPMGFRWQAGFCSGVQGVLLDQAFQIPYI